MKNLKLLMMAAMTMVCISASAQFTNTGSGGSSDVNTSGWNSFYVQFNPSWINYDIKHVDSDSFIGLQLGYSRAFSLSPNIPLYLEVGGALEYSFFSPDTDDDDYYYYYDDEDITNYWLSLKVPVNVVYNIQIPNSTIAIAPYAGMRLRGILLAKEKYGDETYDYFDKDDVGKDATWKRVQVGAQLGTNVKFNKFFIGLGYGFDITEVAKKVKFSELSFTAGLIF